MDEIGMQELPTRYPEYDEFDDYELFREFDSLVERGDRMEIPRVRYLYELLKSKGYKVHSYNRNIRQYLYDDDTIADKEETKETNIDEDLVSLNNWDPLEPDRSVVEIDYSNPHSLMRKFETKKTAQFFGNVLLLESECSNPGFIKYLQDTQGFKLVTTGINGFSTDVKVSYAAPRIVTDEGIAVRPARKFTTINGLIADPDYMRTIIEDIRSHYDVYRSGVLRRRIRRAGIVGGVVIALAAVVTGLALGLKRKGKDMQRETKFPKQQKAETIRPSTPVEPKVVPLSNLEEATGKAMVWFVENIVALVVVGSILLIKT